VKADPTNAGFQRDLGVTLGRIGEVYLARGNLPMASQSFRAAFAIRGHFTKIDPDNAKWQRDAIVSQAQIGDVLHAQGDLPAALDAFKVKPLIAAMKARAPALLRALTTS